MDGRMICFSFILFRGENFAHLVCWRTKMWTFEMFLFKWDECVSLFYVSFLLWIPKSILGVGFSSACSHQPLTSVPVTWLIVELFLTPREFHGNLVTCGIPEKKSNAHQPLSEMVLFKYKYVYKGTSNGSSFIANKILNTFLKEWTNKMAISCVSIDDNKRK